MPDNEKIILNAAECLECEQVIWSATRHDYRTCSCGNISVDGGLDYLRRVGGDEGYEDMSILLDTETNKARRAG